MAAAAGAGWLEGRLHWVGPVAQERLPDYYNAADLLVLPSAYESFGLVALEALACGTPVLACRVGAMEELVRSPHHGRLLPEGTPEALAAAMAEMLAGARPERGHGARLHRSVRRYGWPRVAAAVAGVYGRCLQAGPASEEPLRPDRDGSACWGQAEPAGRPVVPRPLWDCGG
jgi:D-inositol-3-phosphate glycosyltransferase